MSASVAIVGGSGFLGSLSGRAFARAGVETVIRSRRSDPRVDLSDPMTFRALDGQRFIVDLANGTSASPLALARYAIEEGHVLLETTADAGAIGELMTGLAEVKGPGSVVLGGGIFTGLSNLLARAVANDVKGADRLELFLSSSAVSGAGRGTTDLMVAVLARQAASSVGGAITLHPRVERGPNAPLPSGERPTIRASFAEQLMLPRSTGVPNVEVYFAPRPSFAVSAFLLTPRWLNESRAYQWFMRVYLGFLRGFLLRGKASPVEIVARADGPNGTASRSLVTADGLLAGGAAIAATVEHLVRHGAPRGVSFVDDVCELEPIVRRTNELGGAVELGRASHK